MKIRNLDGLKAELARLAGPVAQRLARNAAMAGARTAAAHARTLAPRKTGRLANSIRAMRPPGGQVAGRRVALAGSKLFYSRFIEFGTSKMPARSFLRRAIDEHQPEILAKVAQNLSAGLEREARKQAVPEDMGEL